VYKRRTSNVVETQEYHEYHVYHEYQEFQEYQEYREKRKTNNTRKKSHATKELWVRLTIISDKAKQYKADTRIQAQQFFWPQLTLQGKPALQTYFEKHLAAYNSENKGRRKRLTTGSALDEAVWKWSRGNDTCWPSE